MLTFFERDIDTVGRVRKACGVQGSLLARTPQTHGRDGAPPSRRLCHLARLHAWPGESFPPSLLPSGGKFSTFR
jgi:hypothetical protein